MAAGVDAEGDGKTPSDVNLDPGVQFLMRKNELHNNAETNEEKHRSSEELGQGVSSDFGANTHLGTEPFGW